MEPISKLPPPIWLESTSSTNSALREGLKGYDNLSSISALSQSAGRGQGSHTWFSSPGANLTFSILYRFEALSANKALVITQITTLAISDYLRSKGIAARIKWPNDIWVGDKKICGILIENVVCGGFITESIVGIGLNLNETSWPSDLPNPISLKELTSRTYDLRSELAQLLQFIQKRFAEQDDETRLSEEFQNLLFHI